MPPAKAPRRKGSTRCVTPRRRSFSVLHFTAYTPLQKTRKYLLMAPFFPAMNATILKTFGSNVRRERNAKNITQQMVADRAELDIRSVQRIEKGEFEPRMFTLLRVCHALGCSVERVVPQF
jgi:DNA-binding XRE family transcriptional regulator